MVYAEVLYNFKAVGAEELSLERGALVEVMRIESGPWWWGRIKHDAILSNQNSQQSEGWFPRDFVRVSRNRSSFASMDIGFSFVVELIDRKFSPQVIDSFQQPIKKSSPQPHQSQQQQQQLSNKLVCETNCDIDYLRNPEPTLKLCPNDSRPESTQVANEVMRENVTRELIETEENYVKLLSSLCSGYVKHAPTEWKEK